MSTGILPDTPRGLPPADDPYFYGWRYVNRVDANGKITSERVPLTEWDVLHPQEDDFIVHTDAHDTDTIYLKQSFRAATAGRPDVFVFHDMRIDWEEGDHSVFGPDVVVFENLHSPWPRERGTFPVKSQGASTVVVVEVISPTTESSDRTTKVHEYYRVGVPQYVIVDRDEDQEQSIVRVYGYRATPEGYVPIPEDPRGVWVDFVRLWVRGVGDRVACFDEWGNRIADHEELVQERVEFQARVAAAEKAKEEEKQRAEQEKQRAEQEKQRAEQEKQRAEQEKQRAEQEKQRTEQEKQRAEQEKQRAEQEKQRADVAVRQAAEEKQRAEVTARKLEQLEAELRRFRGDAG